MDIAAQSFNNLPVARQSLELQRCCGASNWVACMLDRSPFPDWRTVVQAADEVWNALPQEDWLEAFSHHPKIGDLDSLRAKFAATEAWSQGEQSGVEAATEQVLQGLADGNREYEERFGYIFIVCATGKTASEMLDLLQERIGQKSGG